MRFSALIKVSGDVKSLEQLFSSELRESKNDRASFKIKNDKRDLLIEVVANDSTALRAMLNSISKLLTIYEKTNEVLTNET